MMENQHPLTELMAETMEKIRGMVDANTVVGEPIVTPDVTLIPISRISMGFASGGSDFAQKNQKPDHANSFGGGSTAGVNIIPLAFLVVRGENVQLLPIVPPNDALDRAVAMAPEIVDKITGFIKEQQAKKKAEENF